MRCHSWDEEIYLEDQGKFLEMMNLVGRLRPLIEEIELSYSYMGWQIRDSFRMLNAPGMNPHSLMRMAMEKAPIPERYQPHSPMANFVLQNKLMPEFQKLERELLESYFQPREHIIAQFPSETSFIVTFLNKCHARRRRANIQDNSTHVCT